MAQSYVEQSGHRHASSHSVAKHARAFPTLLSDFQGNKCTTNPCR